MKFWKNKKPSPNSVTPPFQFYPSPSVLPFPSNITPRKKPYPSSLTPPHQPQQTLPLLINLTPPQQTLPLLINLTPSQKPPVVEPSTLVIRICEYGILYCLMFCDKKTQQNSSAQDMYKLILYTILCILSVLTNKK